MSASDPDLLVACLCAAWCGSCRDYVSVFETQALRFDAVFKWIDIEDEEDALGPLDVENFPTLLIARADEVLFFGRVTPQPQTLARLLEAARDGGLRLTSAIDPAVAALPAIVRRLPG
jgi:thioredoxin 1